MGLNLYSLVFDERTSDPASPAEGEVWYRSDLDEIRAYINATVETLGLAGDLTDHEGDTANPHQVTLEQARTQNNVLAGDVDFNSAGKIVNLNDPTGDQDAATKAWTNSQIQAYLQGLDWQESVLSRYDPTAATPPGPTTGDRYISTATANGWTVNYIYEWNGASWTETVPNEGFATRVEDENKVYIFDGAAWGLWDATIDHGNLQGLGDDDHTQYLLVNGTRAMGGDLDMGGNAITSVGNVDGVDVSAHGSRHDPGGADAVTTAAPVEITDTTEAEGTATSLARSDHQHGHGDRGGGSLHALATSTAHGFLPQSNRSATTDPTADDDSGDGYVVGSIWINTTSDEAFICLDATAAAAVWQSLTASASGGYRQHKAGRVAAGSFSGNPATAAVTFSAAMPSTSYGIQLTALGTGARTFAPIATTKTTSGFTIDLGTGNTNGLTEVAWMAMVDGESS